MKKVNKKKGFTLAELLVVIAILAILIAIAVPIFTGTLDGAHEAVRDANYRAAQSAAMVQYLDNKETGEVFYDYTVNANNELVVTEHTGAGATVGATSETTGIVSVGTAVTP